MGMSRCYALMRGLLILFNIIFLCLGGAVCGGCVWAVWEGSVTESMERRAGICALAAWAGALTIAALAGLCGAARHSASLLAAAFALLALTAVAEGAAGWWGATHLPQLRRALKDRVHYSLRRHYGTVSSSTSMLDTIQLQLECCGVDSTRDWQGSAWSRLAEAPPPAQESTLDLSVGADAAYYLVPASCCDTDDTTECELARHVPAASGTNAGLHSEPCGDKIISALSAMARLPLGIAAALAAIHAASLVLALALCLRARPDHSYKA